MACIRLQTSNALIISLVKGTIKGELWTAMLEILVLFIHSFNLVSLPKPSEHIGIDDVDELILYQSGMLSTHCAQITLCDIVC